MIIKNFLCNKSYYELINSAAFSAKYLLTPENKERTIQNLKRTMFIMNKDKPKKFASVLIPICVDEDADGKISLLFTRRSATIRSHVRQISFPGGILDEDNESFESCVLRETEEEIGLTPSRINILGNGALLRPPSTPAIMPFVGIIENLNRKELKINPSEVEEVYQVSIQDLCAPNVKRHTQFRGGYSSPVFLVNNGQVRIWGITGAITNIFLSCFLPSNIFSSKIEYIAPYSNFSNQNR